MNDTIPVRPYEQFNEQKLADYLRGKLPGSDQPLTVRQFGGGAANLTYLLDYGTQQYVLRRPPLGPVAKSAHDMSREYKVLSVLHQAYPYAPRAFLYGEDTAVLGAEFFVMERRQGVVVRRTIPSAFADMPAAPRRMSEALVDALADFHAVDFAALGLSDLGRPEGFIERQIEGWYKRWHAAKTEDLADMDAVYRWLGAHLPGGTAVSLVHNDYKLDNVMLAPDDPGKIVAVFDWDMCTLGDPLNDLGTLLTYWAQPSDPPYFRAAAMMPVGDDLGFLTRDELVQRYATRSGRSVRDIAFYHALGLFRLTVIIAQIYIRYVRGQTQDPRFAAMGQMIPIMARAAHEICTR
ncbi:MAG: phosphotransferase family protein [Ardenticatenaceae bacterium]|nr:phosphotransferase family protein [Ardenticatenaceae bacterium]MCB9002755.1 phosphotransferase family protein [Ardenticatenaceae bacterium]